MIIMTRKEAVCVAIGVAVIPILTSQLCCGFDDHFDGRDMEEPAGSTCSLLAGPDAGVYGVSFGSGVWLKGAPVHGDMWLSLFQNDSADSFFSGVGITVRLMPRWTFAPFVGGGGSFNYAWSSDSPTNSSSAIPAEVVAEAAARGGKSYWGGHAEGGFRLTLDSRIRLVEVYARHTWSSSGSGGEYWLIGLSTGAEW